MGKAVFPYHSLSRVGKVASKASRIGFWQYEKKREDRLKCVVYESALSTATRSPFPKVEGNETRIPLFSKHSLSRVGNAIKLRKSLAT